MVHIRGNLLVHYAGNSTVPSVKLWQEVYRVLKPGGHLLNFASTRTYHRMACAVEDAGFEIRDQIMWIYGSGFPKSHDVSKAIDKAAGAERELKPYERYLNQTKSIFGGESNRSISQPATDSAKQWQGWGSALKPANEPIVVARKPLEKGLTIAENVLKWGTGALNIDGSRIGTEKVESGRSGQTGFCTPKQSIDNKQFVEGRWPANVILDEVAASVLDISTGLKDNVSRFFYVAKASKRERNAGMGDEINGHPTIKPIKLMEYLINLVTPPGGVVLDPFMGSGSTGVAAKNLGFSFVGIELYPEYFQISEKRINNA